MPFCNLQIQCVLFVVYTVYTNYTIKSDILIRIHNLFHGEVSIFIVQLDDAAVAQDAFILLLDVGNSLQAPAFFASWIPSCVSGESHCP